MRLMYRNEAESFDPLCCPNITLRRTSREKRMPNNPIIEQLLNLTGRRKVRANPLCQIYSVVM